MSVLDEILFRDISIGGPEDFLVLFPVSLASGNQPWVAFVAWVADLSDGLEEDQEASKA